MRAFLFLVPFLIAACGGAATPPTAPASAPPAPPSTAPVTSPAVDPTPGPESPGAQAGCPEEPEPTGTPCFEIAIRDFAFNPSSVSVPTSARVVFTNEDSAAHSIKWADGTPTSPTLANGASTERSFSTASAGTIAYVCGIHGASMSGEIVIDATMPIP